MRLFESGCSKSPTQKCKAEDDGTNRAKIRRSSKSSSGAIVSDSPPSRQSTQAYFKEPEYALRDVEIRDRLWHLRDLMEDFAKQFFGFDNVSISQPDRQFYGRFDAHTLKIIQHVACNSSGSAKGWHEFFIDERKRRAVVLAIIGNVLTEQVFKHILFGADGKVVKRLDSFLSAMHHAGDFERKKRHAICVKSILTKSTVTITDSDDCKYTVPRNFTNHVTRVVAATWTHLSNIMILNPEYRPHHDSTAERLIPALYEIVTQSALLSLHMHNDPHTIYHFSSASKDEILNSANMECFNRVQLEQTHPRIPDISPQLTLEEKKRRFSIHPEEKSRAAREDHALVQIAMMDGVTAYRRGGWETPESTLAHVEYEKSGYEYQGLRSRVLTHAWVYCRWGRKSHHRREAHAGKLQTPHEADDFLIWPAELYDDPEVAEQIQMERRKLNERILEKKAGGVSEAEIHAELNELNSPRIGVGKGV